MTFPTSVKIVEVGPRDGLQNENRSLPTALKLEFIERLSQTGLQYIEVTGFVSSEKIPQTRDAADLMKNIKPQRNIHYSVLVPNEKGYAEAIESGAKEIAIFIGATNTFSQKNIHCDIETSFKRYRKVAALANQDGIPMRGYISCCLGCPYEGEVAPKTVADLAVRLQDLGCQEISLGDTIGVGTPNKVCDVFTTTAKQVPLSQLAAHFHDTYGQAIANLYAVLSLGVNVIDASVAGLGGCPYAKGATGNVATEDVLYLLNGLSIQHGINLQALTDVGMWISSQLGRENASKAAKALYQSRGTK